MENEKNRQKSEVELTGHSNSRLSVHFETLFENIDVSFDRITVVGGFIQDREYWVKEKLESLVSFDLRDVGYDRFKCHGLENRVFVEYNRKQAQAMGRSEVRVEFNPNELNTEEKQIIQYVFLDNMRDKHFSRIDVAFDIPIDLQDYLAVSDKSVKKTFFYGRDDKPETKYFGVRDSERYIRIYNKKKQLSEVKEKEIEDKHLWRIEFELKRSMTTKWDKCFDDLHIIQPAWQTIEKDNTRAMVYMLMNEQGEWGKLERRTKYRYKKLMKEISDVDITDEMKKALNKKQKQLSEELKGYTEISYHDKLYNFDFGHE